MLWDYDYLTNILGRVLTEISSWLPSLAAALALVIFGWIAAGLSRTILVLLLRRLGFDKLTERIGVTRALTEIGIESLPAEFISRIAYWVILIVFFLAAAESLGIGGVQEALTGILSYFPSIFAALLILIFGGVIARMSGNAIGALAERSGVKGGIALGQGMRYVFLIFVAVIAVGQLGVETTLLVFTVVVLIGTLSLALAIAFGWGSREIARNVMAGFHVREAFAPGQHLTVRGHTGKLVAIGSVKFLLETGEGTVSLPNSVLTEEEVITLAKKE
ncbi:MAG: mechanosensitive ion channel [Deltaproteobacteria bacterium]|nr:mechanosensitive ion channel [Deltaproteobacteria bacterium]TLN03983.1 MAG: mechanosensitive ion channel [bacterium]